MTTLTDRTPSPEVITAFVIVFVVISSIIISLGNYYGQNTNHQVAGAIDTADQIKLTNEYKTAFLSEFDDYLILDTDSDWMNSDILSSTVTIKNNLLALKVPSEFKQIHLNAVVALSEIEKGINVKDLDLVLPNVYKLRDIIANF